jgi:pimeloyl-ACP methyl ester carboxylesterase
MTTFTTSDGTVLHYEDRQGSGDVIVLVHGYTGSMRDWDETVPRLPADWRIIRVDLRGAGDSSHAEIERGVMANLKVSDGHLKQSLETMVGLRLADRLRSLRLPVLMVGGDRDNLVPVQTMLDSFARIPNCGLQIYHRVGHMVQLEVADEFAALVQDFAEHDAKKSEAAAARS